MSTTTTETKLQHDFAIFQVEFNQTRLMRYSDMLVYNCGRSASVFSAYKEAEKIIVDKNLNLVVEINSTSAILPNTLIIKEKI